MPKSRLASVPDLEQELDRLYGLPLDEFTAARNDLAKRLGSAGQDDAAARVKALPKPPVPVWAVNALARAEPKAVAAVAKAGEQLVDAQEQALGGGDREGFAQARGAHGAAVQHARDLLGGVLESGGRTATPATLERAAGLLRSASLDAHARPLLVAGRLPDELEASGFSLVAGLELPAVARTSGSRRDERAELKRQLAEARREAKELRRSATDAARAAGRLRAEADRAGEGAAEADEAAAAAEASVQELERRLDAD